MNDLSKLIPVKPDQGKAQWVEGKITGIAKDEATRTHLVGIPPLMPCTIIFVHGVNSEGEWYRDAAAQFAEGLKKRLGRDDLEGLEKEKDDEVPSRRFKRVKNMSAGRYHSPILPFYWGYKVPPKGRLKLVDKARTDRPDAWGDRFANVLRKDGAWGGGPFQNGTPSLLQFWQQPGFRTHIGPIDMNRLNPIVGRSLHDCPDRTYYIHAARRLALLVATIRADFPDEPINIVSHSQGTMVSLCALFYLKQQQVRAPDTLMLNNSPYRFDTAITDFLTAAEGATDVQSAPARIETFKAAAAIMQSARTDFQPRPAADAECTHAPKPRHACDDRIFVHHPPAHPDWQPAIGAGPVDAQGRHWWESPPHCREDNRGKLIVNFNPGDRVMGIQAIQGMGWCGIPTSLLDEHVHTLGVDVMQRIFARGSNDPHNLPVGRKQGYKQPYYYEQIVPTNVVTEWGGTWRTEDGAAVQTLDDQWRYLDGRNGKQWKIASEKILGLVPALGTIGMYGPGGAIAYSYINAPAVPVPAVLGDDFDGEPMRYDGEAQPAEGGRPATVADPEQQADYKDEGLFEPSQEIEAQCTPQQLQYRDDKGLHCTRLETQVEVERRRRDHVGREIVSPTNHAAILRHEGKEGFPVERVLSYDLTVGPGYAFGDEAYWNYLLDLADWKASDPYYTAGNDAMDASGGVLRERSGIENAPEGIDRRTVAPPLAARQEGGAA